MTEIDFHFNVPDRLAYACRLLRKAARRGARVVVCAPTPLLSAFDRQLWTFEPLEFIPHVHAEAGKPLPERLRDTPIWLTQDAALAPHHEVLLNLGASVAAGFESFPRLVELVSSDEAEREAGRARWKHYAERGYVISRHDVAASPGG